MLIKKNILSVLLLLSLALLLTGCKDKNIDETDSSAPPELEDYVYAPKFYALPEELGSIRNFAVFEDKVYTLSFTDSDHIFVMDLADGQWSELEIITDEPYRHIHSMTLDSEGVWLCAYGIEVADGDARENITLMRMDNEGNVTEVIRPQSLQGISTEISILDMHISGEGNISLILSNNDTGTNSVHVYDDEGDELFSFPYEAYEFYDIDGDPYLCDMFSISQIDMDGERLGETTDLDFNTTVYSGKDGWVYYTGGSSFFRYNVESEEEREEFLWPDLGLVSNNVIELHALEDGNLVALISPLGGSPDPNEIVLLEKVSPGETVEKIELALATLYPSDSLEYAVGMFNKNSDEYRIRLKEYSADQGVAGVDKLSLDIITGNTPDLIDISMANPDLFIAKGLLMDLYQFMDEDETMGRDAFVPSLLKALEKDGALYLLPHKFSILTFIGKADDEAVNPDWDIYEFLEYARSLPEGVNAFPKDFYNMAVLRVLTGLNLDYLVDWDTGECNFNEPWFIDIIEYSGGYPSYEEVMKNDYRRSSYDSIADGTQSIDYSIIGHLNELQMYPQAFGGEIVFLGIPTPYGGENVFSLNGSISITTACEYPDAAWEFVRQYIQSDGHSTFGLRSLVDKLEETFDESKSIETPGGGIMYDFEYVIKAMTEEELLPLRELIASTTRVNRTDAAVWGILEEVAARYYDGDISAQEAADNIAGRVQTYVNEQR